MLLVNTSETGKRIVVLSLYFIFGNNFQILEGATCAVYASSNYKQHKQHVNVQLP